jgi:hypothetical protein
MEIVRPHIEKTTRCYNQTGSVLEPTGYEKKKTEGYMEMSLGKRMVEILVKAGEN